MCTPVAAPHRSRAPAVETPCYEECISGIRGPALLTSAAESAPISRTIRGRSADTCSRGGNRSGARRVCVHEVSMKPTDIAAPDYFHKVVDCQWACPAHTPVPEYIRMIAAGRYGDAYMVNWKSNVFPGILGRTCDRPCEPACRRGRVEKEP